MQERDRADGDRKERRSYDRYNIYLPLTIKGKNSEGRLIEERATSVNIGRSGAYAISRHEWNSSDVLTVGIVIPGILGVEDEMVFTCRSAVVRCDRSVTDGLNGVALSFLSDFSLQIAPEGIGPVPTTLRGGEREPGYFRPLR